MSFRVAAGAVLCVVLAIPVVGAPRQPVTFGVNEGTTAGQMAHEMAGVLAQLQTSPSIDVKLRVFPNHDALAAALQRGDVDLAFLGAVKYVESHFTFGATPVVAECCSVRTFIAVKPGSPFKIVEQLRRKRFGFGYGLDDDAPDSGTHALAARHQAERRRRTIPRPSAGEKRGGVDGRRGRRNRRVRLRLRTEREQAAHP